MNSLQQKYEEEKKRTFICTLHKSIHRSIYKTINKKTIPHKQNFSKTSNSRIKHQGGLGKGW